MEQNFQTSFIPKKPAALERPSSARAPAALTVLSVFFFFTMLLAAAGIYFYDQLLAKKIVRMQGDLNLAEDRLEPERIARLRSLDRRLSAAEEILSGHIVVTPVFEALQSVTMKTVSYVRFSWEGSEALPKVKLSGVASGYRSVALQSDLFSADRRFVNPVFSNLSLNEFGNVAFDLNFSVDPSLVNYRKSLELPVIDPVSEGPIPG